MAAGASAAAPSPARSGCVLVGVDSRGNWIVRDVSGRRGGLFVSRAAALHYARLEFGHRALPIVVLAGNLELDMSSAG
jgi:hypothetical protein